MLPASVRLRPWALRALVLTPVFGVAQAAFVALRSWSPDMLRLWSVLLLLVVAAIVIAWVGAEIVLDRRPPEWTWFFAALATAPSAGLLSWILLALFVDDTGVADLQSALVGRASFTALLILAAVFVGSRLGWLSMRRHGEGADDPMLDADDDAVAAQAALDRADVMPDPRAPSAARAAARVGVVPTTARPAEPAVAGVRTPRRRSPERVPAGVEVAGSGAGGPGVGGPGVAGPEVAGPEIAERERMPEAPRLAGQRRVSTVRPAGGDVSSPFGPDPAGHGSTGLGSAGRSADVPESMEPPVVAVLPAFPRPGGPLDPTGSQPAVDASDLDDRGHRGGGEPAEPAETERGPRRKFGLRRPKS
ncbi:hypothetical protein [Actinomycetospora straminea]|uniref:Uncharacterized protein n=1 Tax=Actinomycetospora straminea TaxID=663607 RepID=A0ABP9DTU6_9PSEU|nr:hypothetical protein [Actinomycetospora straminea]MDD7932555.1 hypothetical protein [Actinomycetospora straminea]